MKKRITFFIRTSFSLGGLIALTLTAFTAQAQNTWTQKVDFGGTARAHAIGFSIGSRGYIGTGGNDVTFFKDFWEYDPATNVWTQKADFGGTARWLSTGFSIGSKGYVGTGSNVSANNDFWEYDPLTNAWIQKANFGGTARWRAVGFSIGSKGYIGTGYDGSFKNDFWEYDPATDIWTQKANCGGTGRETAVGFSIGSKGYVGTGDNGAYKNDFWEYDPFTNTWTQKTNFAGTARTSAVGFSIGNIGYIGTGGDCCSEKQDFWEYDPSTNSWTQKADFSGTPRHGATGFAINNKGYIGTGYDGISPIKKDFWEFTSGAAVICNFPTTFSTGDITSGSAKLKWEAVSGAISYKIRYKVSGTSQWTNIKSIDNHKTLNALAASTKYTWQVKSFCEIKPVVASEWSSKQFFTTAPMKISDELPQATFFEIYPNPFTSSTTISFSVHQDSQIQIELLDIAGRKLRTLLNENVAAGNPALSAGKHEINLNRDQLNAGIYFIKFFIDGEVMMKKVVVE